MSKQPSRKPEKPLLVDWPLDQSTMQIQLRHARQKLDRYRTAQRLAQQEIERRGQVIRSLTTFTYQASNLTALPPLLQLALTRALETTRADIGAIVLVNWERKRLSLEVSEGLTPALTRILTGQQFDQGAATLMPHLVAGRGILLEENASVDVGERMLLTAGQVTSLVSLPLQVGSQMQGALILGIQGKRIFTPADLYYLLALAQETTVALEALRLREIAWQLAESFLGEQEIETLKSEMPALNMDAPLTGHSPLQAELSQLAGRLGGTAGAIFALDKAETGVQVTLVTSHNLSPVFTNTFAAFPLSEDRLPRRFFSQPSLVLDKMAHSPSTPGGHLLAALQEEGAESLVAGRFKGSDSKLWLIIITAPEAGALSDAQRDSLLTAGKSILPLLDGAPAILPASPLKGILNHVASQDAPSDDLEHLLEAMMEAEEEVQRHNTDLVTLNTIAALFNQTLNQDQILSQVVEQVRETLQTDAAWVYLAEDSQEERLILQAHAGLSNRYVWGMRQLPFGKHLEGTAARQNRPCFVDNVQDGDCPLLLEQENIQAMAVIPLASPTADNEEAEYNIIGVMAIAMHRPHAWKPREVRLLTAIANQVTLAINNAQRFSQVTVELDMLSNSNQLLQAINNQLIEDNAALEARLAALEQQIDSEA
jgi:GAF domain-containing protein